MTTYNGAYISNDQVNEWGRLVDESRNFTVDSTPNYNSKDFASKTYANLINEQYDDYRTRFLPYEQRLMSLADSSQMLDEQLGRLTTNIDKNYDSLGQQQQIMNQRYGLTQSASQVQSQDRNTNINKALATAHGENNTRLANSDMQNGILTGASSAQQNFKDMGG